MIQIELHKTLHGSAGVMNLSVQHDLQPAGFVALFGPSGAGKTSILRMMAGLTEPDSGKLVVNGEVWFDSARRINLPPQKRSIGFVFQDYALFPNLTVRQNLAYALDHNDDAWINELLEITGLAALQDRMPISLSGGQKQRVALARAVARKPRLLLLDEPLSALDISLRQQMQKELSALHQRFGFTAILVSHDLGEVFKLAQHVIQIDSGKIVRHGTPAEVFLNKQHAGKLNIQAQVLEVRVEQVIIVVSLLIGQDIVDIIASEDEVAGLKAGDFVTISVKSFSSLLFKSSSSPGLSGIA